MSGITLDEIQASFSSIKVSDGTNDLLIDASGHLSINDGGNSLTVDAVDLDIRDLTHSTDSIKIGDGVEFLAVNSDGSINAQTIPDAYDNWQTSTLTATTTAAEIASTPLANRLNMLIQNLGNADIYIGEDNTVTSSTGVKVPKGGSAEFLFGSGSDVYCITSSGSSDLRIAEFSA